MSEDGERTYEERIEAAQSEMTLAGQDLARCSLAFNKAWKEGASREDMTVLRGRMGEARRRCQEADAAVWRIVAERLSEEEVRELNDQINNAVGEVLAQLVGVEASR
jgi:hypothetical protein